MHSSCTRLLALLLLVNFIFCEELISYEKSLFALKLLVITPASHSVAIFLTVHSKQNFIENLVRKFINYLRTKCNTPNSNGLLVIAIQPKTKENVHAAATMLYRIHSTVNTSLTNVSYFFQYLISYVNSLP